jgi:tRNA dimethylallyltransferase
LSPPVAVVDAAIATRARRMFADGLVDEARALAARLPAEHALLSTIGTQEALALASGALDREAAIATVVTRTRQYARRQRTWFRREPWWSAPQPERAGVVDGSG